MAWTYFRKRCLSACNRTGSTVAVHLPRDIIHEYFRPAPTSITPLSQVFSLSSSSATCLHSASFCCVPSPQAPSKSNPEPCADGLWYSSHRFSAAANGCSVWRSALHSCFCQQFNSKGKLTKPFLSNYLCGAVIIGNAGGIATGYIDQNYTCTCVPVICKHLLKTYFSWSKTLADSLLQINLTK